ncbi:general substrate transporter [Stereum hirsutum FP-91666 SS1]|uniref:general substrate transporter n=1 Tax=Stereum hirsutum (strain FP-91666) TaxID=721885 RepID=UPI000440C9C8|nr:general substrate transporter [Stereum hirsutum FP-91666 SS1]EIM90365.1 general substrate transporter [Stereum hirsutum FP-91666 SS1]
MQRATSQYLHTYTLCTVFASIGGFIFGFDTGSIGPVTVMPQFEAQFNSISATLQGLIVSSILITASISSIFAGHLSDRISRTRTFALGGLVFGVGSLIASTSYKLPQLFVGRCIAGVGEGLFLSTVTVYILEISPTNLRGRLSCLCQLLITTGIAAGYFVSYGSINLSSSVSWRLLFIMQAIVSFIFSAGSLFLPHSPRWLQHVGRTEDAARAWARLGFTATEAEKEQEVEERERDELTSEQEYARTGANVRDKRKGVTVTALFAKDVRKRTLLGVFLMGMQQACGIDGVLYYAPVLFSQAGLSSTTSAFLASGIAGILNIVCTIITQIFTDKWGRHSSMINGGLVISGTMIAIGSLYASQASTTTAGKWTIIALIYVFVVAYATSWAVVNRIYCSEIQPMHTRAAATSLGQCANWVVNWIIAFSTPLFLSRSSSGPYFLFGACALITVIVCILFQPESRGVSLEGLDKIFEVSPWRKVLRRIAPRMHGRRFGGGSVVSRGSASGGARDEAIGLTPIGA